MDTKIIFYSLKHKTWVIDDSPTKTNLLDEFLKDGYIIAGQSAANISLPDLAEETPAIIYTLIRNNRQLLTEEK